uniref:Uncharacterized protein n=1 Tax=Knipowitschia caucasica TaxID=637954 RepID=A0AAV2MTX0_KNICA
MDRRMLHNPSVNPSSGGEIHSVFGNANMEIVSGFESSCRSQDYDLCSTSGDSGWKESLGGISLDLEAPEKRNSELDRTKLALGEKIRKLRDKEENLSVKVKTLQIDSDEKQKELDETMRWTHSFRVRLENSLNMRNDLIPKRVEDCEALDLMLETFMGEAEREDLENQIKRKNKELQMVKSQQQASLQQHEAIIDSKNKEICDWKQKFVHLSVEREKMTAFRRNISESRARSVEEQRAQMNVYAQTIRELQQQLNDYQDEVLHKDEQNHRLEDEVVLLKVVNARLHMKNAETAAALQKAQRALGEGAEEAPGSGLLRLGRSLLRGCMCVGALGLGLMGLSHMLRLTSAAKADVCSEGRRLQRRPTSAAKADVCSEGRRLQLRPTSAAKADVCS